MFKPCDLDSDLYTKNSHFGCWGNHVSQTHLYFQYLDQGLNEAAILAWGNATLLKPTHVNAWSSLYVSLILTLYYFQYLDIGRNEAAILAWLNATLLKPTHVNAWSSLYVSLILTLYYFQYLDLGRNEAAILAWRNATLLKPTHVNAWSNMIILFDNSSKFVTVHLKDNCPSKGLLFHIFL